MTIAAALALMMTSGAAIADECKDMATKIADSANLVVRPKSPNGRMFGLGNGDGYGATGERRLEGLRSTGLECARTDRSQWQSPRSVRTS
jgi:hypothetical protein